MTFWVPVVFACMNSGCAVVYDDPHMSERECEKRVLALVQMVQAQRMQPVVASCLKADLKMV